MDPIHSDELSETPLEEVIKQLAFSPIKDAQLSAAHAAIEAANSIMREQASLETDSAPAAAPEFHEEQSPAVEENKEEEATIIAASEPVEETPVEVAPVVEEMQSVAPVEVAVVAPVVAEASLAVIESAAEPIVEAAPVVAAVAESKEAEEEAPFEFPTFSTVVDQQELSYVSDEMKQQEKLLLESMQSVSGPVAGKKMNSSHSTPSMSARKRAGASTARLASSASRPRISATQTPKSARSDFSATATPLTDRKRPSTAVKRKLTLAASPQFSTRTRAHLSAATPVLSTEQQEAARIEREKQALRKLKMANAKNLDNVLYAVSAETLPVRSTKSLTQPQDFKFHTANRSTTRKPAIATTNTTTVPSSTLAVDKKKTSDRLKKVISAAASQLTRSKPFSFQTDSRSRPMSAASSVHSTPAKAEAPRAAIRSSSRPASRAASRSSSPTRAITATPTQPREFVFHTSKRAAAKPASTPAPESVKKEKAIVASTPHLTQPKPFNLMTDARAPAASAAAASSSSASATTGFVSMANQMANWLGSGNDRVVQAPILGSAGASHLTAPKEFHFHTSERVKSDAKSGSSALTTEERIMAEIEAAKKRAEVEKEKEKERLLHAAPRAIESFRAPLTQMQPFHLSGSDSAPKPRVDKEAEERAAVEKEREERKQRLLAAAKLNGVTVPQAPELAVLQRAPLKEQTAASTTEGSSNSSSKTAAASNEKPILTAPKPFNLSTESRGAAKAENFVAKVSAESETLKKAANFRAAPMPDTDNGPSFIPKLTHRKILADLTPQLRSTQLHAKSEQLFEKQLKAEKAADQQARKFTAKPVPATVLQAPTFQVKPSNKTLTAPMPVQLTSDARAEKRHEFDIELSHKMAQADAAKKAAEEQRAKEEAAAIKKLRESLVHRAQPVPVFIKPASAFRAPR